MVGTNAVVQLLDFINCPALRKVNVLFCYFAEESALLSHLKIREDLYTQTCSKQWMGKVHTGI